MLSNKRSRIFVSFLTLMAFLSVLVVGLQSVGVQAQGPNGVGDVSGSAAAAPEAVQHRLDAEAAQQTSGNLSIYKSAASSTNIKVGDVQSYTVKVVANATQTNITLKDVIPHFARFNRIISSTGFTPQFDAAGHEIESASAFTLTTDAEAEVTFEVDTTALCGQSINNMATATAGGKSYTAMRDTMAWDNIHVNYNFESDPGFAMSGSWAIDPVISPTIGAVSGRGALATNPTGLYTSTGVAGPNATHRATITLDFTSIPVVDGKPLYVSWSEYFNANTIFDNAEVTLKVGVKKISLHDTKTAYGLGSVDTGDYEYQKVDLLGANKFTAAELAGKTGTLEFKFSTSPFDNDFGWYVDDLAVTSCGADAFAVNKIVDNTSFTSCNTTTPQATNSTKGVGFNVTSGTTVHYCYAIKNTGSTPLSTLTLTDDKLGTLVTTDTFNLAVGDTYTTVRTAVITDSVTNIATWKVGSASQYSYTTDAAATFNDIASSGTPLEINDGEDVVAIRMPFTFTLFTAEHTPGISVTVSNNGSMLFTETNSALEGLDGSNSPLPLTGTADTRGIFPLWDDYADPSVPLASKVYTEVKGTAPSRMFIIQWTDMRHQGDANNTNGITFQAILHETTNNVEFVYDDVDFNNATYNNGASATIGLNNSNTDAVQYSYNGGQAISDDFAITFSSGGSGTKTDSATVSIDRQITLELAKTVSESAGDACEASDAITVTGATVVHYCFTVKNTSGITVDFSTLTDTHLGTLIDDEARIIAPGASSSFIKSTNVAATTVNTATWSAEASNYGVSVITNTHKFENIGFGSAAIGTRWTPNGEGHDEEQFDVPLGFTFRFYGKEFSDVLIGRNGGMIFDHTATGADDVFPDNQNLFDENHPWAIFPFWDDLDNDSGNVYYKTMTNTNGTRRFIVQWDRLLHYDNSTSEGTFQVILHEGSNRIDFNYKDVIFGTTDDSLVNGEVFDYGRSATIGLNRDQGKANIWTYNNGTTITQAGNSLYHPTVPVTNNMTIRWDPLSGMAMDVATVTVVSNPAIVMTKTVGTTADVCATTQEITDTVGKTYYYCFWIENTGDVTLTQHTLVDAQVGVNNTYNFDLAPGQVVNITEIPGGGVEGRSIFTDTMNTAVWTATAGSANSAAYTDTAMVYVILPPTAVEMTGVTATNAGGQLPLGSLVVGMLLLVAGGYVVHRRRNQ